MLLPGDVEAWSVTDPDLIRRLLAHKHISKDAARHWPAYIRDEIPKDWPLRIWADVRNALSAYADEHRRLRRPLAAAFAPRRVRALEQKIREVTHALLDGLEAQDTGGVVDIRGRLAWRLPLLIVNTMLGVPEGMHDEFRDAVGQLFNTNLSPADAKAARVKVYALIDTLIQYKQLHPADDVTSALIKAHNEGQISKTELADSFVLLLGAGHETTVNLLHWGFINLLTHPDQLAAVLAGQVSWEQVVEETLRHQAPLASILPRFPTQDVIDDESGITFAAGELILINYAAAGRDPHTHGDDAELFNLHRATSDEHLAFGHGAHFCPGAELARLEARIALEAFFTRFPKTKLEIPPEQLTPLSSLISNGHTELPVTLGTGT
ncbi:cytochrome P450 [Streptomyces sp. NPDC020707]|uniref:cytochrome P450 n=1 Tax=Streptomyces sp. NPDC020707 TaxID=3365084 RepID=UPI00379F2294